MWTCRRWREALQRSKPSRLLKNRVGAPDGEGALPVRRSLWSDVYSLVGLAKSDPRASRRRSRSQRCIFVLDQGRLWASGTIRQPPDEDAIAPSAEYSPGFSTAC
jgi:hypothetical protein